MRSWEEQSAEFDTLGIVRVGISPDSVAEAEEMTAQHKFSMTLLSDAGLAVTDLYNIRNTDGKTPIPTTVFITPDGIVRWLDVSPDYRKRNEGKIVLKAIQDVLAGYTPAAEDVAAQAGPKPVPS